MSDWQTYHEAQRQSDQMDGGNWGPVIGLIVVAVVISVYGVMSLLGG